MSEVIDQEPEDRDRPDLMRLRCAPDQLSPDLADSLDVTERATHQVNAANLQPRKLAPAQTPERKQQHRGPVVACCLCEHLVSGPGSSSGSMLLWGGFKTLGLTAVALGHMCRPRWRRFVLFNVRTL